jgi:hypothetical protein
MKKLLAGETVDPALVYFRTQPKFETSAPELQWLTSRSSSAWASDIRTRWSSASTGVE